jgi:hypothetical protein
LVVNNEAVMKFLGSFLSCMILSGVLLGSALPEQEVNLSSESVRCRTFVQELTNDNSSVLNQYDTFITTLQKAYNNGEGIIDSDVVRVIKAIDFAAEKHRFQKRKGAEELPYIIHPIGVAHYLMTIGNVRDIDIIIAALLHDTVEDTGTSFVEIQEQFGLRVESFVRELTDDKSLVKAERKQLQIVNASHKSAGAAQVKLADKLYNLTDIMYSPPTDWEKERIDDYFRWAKRVVDNLPWVNASLKAAVDHRIEAYWTQNGDQ